MNSSNNPENDKTSNLLSANVTAGNINLNNIIETKVTPNFLVRGTADVDLGGGVGHNLNIKDVKVLGVNAGLDVKVSNDLKVSIDAGNIRISDDPGYDINKPAANISVNYKL